MMAEMPGSRLNPGTFCLKAGADKEETTQGGLSGRPELFAACSLPLAASRLYLRQQDRLSTLWQEAAMIRVKTFGEPLAPFKAQMELKELDARVNDFIHDNQVKKVISISDAATTEEGSTIGLVRVMVYED
jgi:hypothetical protein